MIKKAHYRLEMPYVTDTLYLISRVWVNTGAQSIRISIQMDNLTVRYPQSNFEQMNVLTNERTNREIMKEIKVKETRSYIVLQVADGRAGTK